MKLLYRFVTGYVNIDDLFFGDSDKFDETKWTLLLWSLELDALDPQFRVNLRKVPENYLPTVLALTFLLQVKKNSPQLKQKIAYALLMSI